MLLQPGEVVLSVASFRDYWALAYRRAEGGPRVVSMMGASTALSREAHAEIKTVLGEQGSLISFNGTEYDLPLLAAALGGASVGRMYRESQGSVGKSVTRAVLKRRHIDLQRLIPMTIEGWRGGADEAFAQRSGLRQAAMRLHLRDIRGVEWNADSGIAGDPVRRRMVDDRCPRGCGACSSMKAA